MIDEKRALELERRACLVRLELIKMFSFGKAHHFGGSLSCAEIGTALYFHAMNYSAKNMHAPDRDRFIMSKGHSVPTQYVLLSMLGIIPSEELGSLKTLGSRLQGHPDPRKTPGIEAPTGSLGMGLSYANGMAMAGRLDGLGFRVFLLLGDGELQEGQVWEAAMNSANRHLNNICVIVDHNRFESQDEVERSKGVEPLLDKWRSFGWNSFRVDGHDMRQLCGVLDRFDGSNERPFLIIADTVKGKGVSFMENSFKYHNASLSEAEYAQAIEEVQGALAKLGNQGGRGG
jgi:transketolase